VPIFNRFATRNGVRTARLQQQNMALQLDATKKSLYKEVQQAWYNAVAAESQYTSSVNAVEASQATFDLTEQKLENGKATLLEFDEAKQNLKKSLSDRIQAKYDYLFRCKILDFYKGVAIE
jgi:outer membrane protein